MNPTQGKDLFKDQTTWGLLMSLALPLLHSFGIDITDPNGFAAGAVEMAGLAATLHGMVTRTGKITSVLGAATNAVSALGTELAGQKDLLQSKTFWGAALTLALPLLNYFGVSLVDPNSFAAGAAQMGGLLLAGFGQIKREKAVTSVLGIQINPAAAVGAPAAPANETGAEKTAA